MKEHEQMIDALTQRKPAAMRAVLLRHLNNKRDVVMAQLVQQQKSREAGEGEQA
jgi:DNA-binding GntR family transcriptional regulator